MKAHWLIFAAALAVAASAGHGATPRFQGLGDLPGGGFDSGAWGISPNGTFVVGCGLASGGYEAFRWSESEGMQGLGVKAGDEQSFANDVSADGTVVAGISIQRGGQTRAAMWTEVGGWTHLGEIYPGDPQGWTFAVSADGSVVVGTNEAGSTWEAFRWTQATGMVGLGDLPGGSYNSGAKGISADGSVIVGYGGVTGQGLGRHAMRWTQATGMADIGDLPGGEDRAEALGVSADGSVVVGYGAAPEDQQAFRWTAATGMVGLGDLPGQPMYSQANDVSADGSVIVGYGHDAYGWPGQQASIWDPSNGMRKLRDVLVDEYGLDLTGWALREATGISDDGLTIVGWGHNPDGNKGAWIATIPEPATLTLLAAGLGAVWMRKRRVTK